ncbi:retinoblastoma-associated protein-like [Lampetra fluviatilis]
MMSVKEGGGHHSSTASLVSSSGSNSASSSDSEEDGWRRKLEKVCVAVGAADDTCKMAWRLWELTCKPESVQSCGSTMAVCLYIAAMKPLPIKVTQLLSELGVNFDDFYHAVRNMDAPPEMQLSLTTLNNQFQVVAAIYKKFQTMYGKIFNEDCRGCASPPFPSKLARECWTMFILAKGHGLQAGTDLVSAFHLLLCVLDHFASRCPASSLHEPYASAVRDVKPASGVDTDGEVDPADSSGEHSYSQGTVTAAVTTAAATVTTPVVVVMPPAIALLCRHNNCNHEEVMSIHAGCFLPFLSSLPATTKDALLQLLSERYGALYEQTRGIDERDFLVHHPTLVPNVDKLPQAPGSPTRSQEAMPGPQQTPIRTTMNTVQQLKLILNSASDEPSATLNSYLSRCSVNPRAEIARTVEDVGSRFQRNFVEATSAGCAGTANQRLGLAVRLYYRVMEAILKSEEERLNIQDFSTLLGIETFHVSLLACSLEVVMATYNSSWSGSCGAMIGSPEEAGGVSFPWVLGVLSLSPYNFYKVLESFIRAEPSLTRDVIKHLRCCEEAVLDSLAWQPDSPLLEELRSCRDSVTDAASEPHGAAFLARGFSSALAKPSG